MTAPKNERRRAGALRGWEHRRERDEACARNIEGVDGRLLPLWEQVKRRMKATPFMSREEAFYEYVKDTGDEWLEAHAENAEAAAEAMIAAYVAADRFDVDTMHDAGAPEYLAPAPDAAPATTQAEPPSVRPARTDAAPVLRLIQGGGEGQGAPTVAMRLVLSLVASGARVPENDPDVIDATIAALRGDYLDAARGRGRYKLTARGRAALAVRGV